MKTRLFIMTLLITLILGCQKFDGSDLWNSIKDLNNRVEKLEEICEKMNTNISSLQTIVSALQKNDAIKSINTLPNGEGYTIVFVSGKSINIYNGTDGKDGEDGTDGKDGADGQDGKDSVTPVISVRQDTDGIYYWTVNGEWLLVNGQKVKAVGTDGKDGKPGSNGVDGITPEFKIEGGYWYISYDNKKSWKLLGKATGDNGLNGSDGESFFKGVSIENGYVCFILNDTESTMIKLPFAVETKLTINIDLPGTLKRLLTEEQKCSVLSLKIIGHINETDVKTLNTQMRVLRTLDVSETFLHPTYSNSVKVSTFNINPYDKTLINRTLYCVITPKCCSKVWFDYCASLQKIIVPSDSTVVGFNGSDYVDASPEMSDNIDSLIFAEGVTYIPNKAAFFFPFVHLPQSTETVCYGAFTSGSKSRVITIQCDALTPPKIHNGASPEYGGKYVDSFYDAYKHLKNITLYVPQESLELYKSTSGWNQFKNILPIDE